MSGPLPLDSHHQANECGNTQAYDGFSISDEGDAGLDSRQG
ncbi:MAG: hypothetical protein ABI679_16620 [Gemmatimonadota bacterium]